MSTQYKKRELVNSISPQIRIYAFLQEEIHKTLHPSEISTSGASIHKLFWKDFCIIEDVQLYFQTLNVCLEVCHWLYSFKDDIFSFFHLKLKETVTLKYSAQQ